MLPRNMTKQGPARPSIGVAYPLFLGQSQNKMVKFDKTRPIPPIRRSPLAANQTAETLVNIVGASRGTKCPTNFLSNSNWLSGNGNQHHYYVGFADPLTISRDLLRERQTGAADFFH